MNQSPTLHPNTRTAQPIAKGVVSGASLAIIHDHSVNIAISNRSSVSMSILKRARARLAQVPLSYPGFANPPHDKNDNPALIFPSVGFEMSLDFFFFIAWRCDFPNTAVELSVRTEKNTV